MFINPSEMIKKGGGRGGAVLGILMLLLLTIDPIVVHSGSEVIPNYAATFTPAPGETFTPIPPQFTATPVNPTATRTATQVPTATHVYNATSTPYYEPTNQIPGISTPTPSVQGDCPLLARDPDRELSLNWMKACSKCPTTGGSVITPIPRLPTISYGNLGTATPALPFCEGGAMPDCWYVTPTAVPSNVYRINKRYGNVFTDLVPMVKDIETGLMQDDIWFRSIDNGYVGLIEFGINQKGNVNVSAHPYQDAVYVFIFNVGDYSGNYNIEIEIIESNISIIPVGTIYQFSTGQTQYRFNIMEVVAGTNETLDWELKYNVKVISSGYSGGIGFEQNFERGGYNVSITGFVETTWYPVAFLPNDVGYCNNYVYADEEEPTDPLVVMPDIFISQGVCMDFVPPFSWFRNSAGSYLFDVDLSFPGIGICPIWVELGDMELAGISIPMDILFLPAVMFIFGLLFKM